jgi:hypothetical protein
MDWEVFIFTGSRYVQVQFLHFVWRLRPSNIARKAMAHEHVHVIEYRHLGGEDTFNARWTIKHHFQKHLPLSDLCTPWNKNAKLTKKNTFYVTKWVTSQLSQNPATCCCPQPHKFNPCLPNQFTINFNVIMPCTKIVPVGSLKHMDLRITDVFRRVQLL